MHTIEEQTIQTANLENFNDKIMSTTQDHNFVPELENSNNHNVSSVQNDIINEDAENISKSANPNPFYNIFQKSQVDDTFYENFQVNQSEVNFPKNGVSKKFDETPVIQQNYLNTEQAIDKSNIDVIENTPNSGLTEVLDNEVLGVFSNNNNGSNIQNELSLKPFENENNLGRVLNENTDSSNLNLLELLQMEKTNNDVLKQENQKLQLDRDNLSRELQNVQNDTENTLKLKEDIGILHEQLQLHVKTVNVLVGEKTELITQINKYESIVKSQNTECEELQGRLRASRHKASDLEKELGQFKVLYQELENNNKKLLLEFDKVQNELTLSVKQCEDLKDEESELKEKLKSLALNCNRLENEVSEKSNELSLSHLRIQQLTSGDTANLEGNWESIIEEKKLMQTKLSEMEQAINKSKSETVQVSQQYKQYCQQLSTQMQGLVGTLQEKTTENEKLSLREKELVNHINDLEKQLQSAPKTKSTTSINTETCNKELNDLKEKYISMEKQCEDLNHNLDEKTRYIESLEDEMKAYKNQIDNLEESLETIQADKLDTAKLNAAIESDKVAAARSMAQNADLKLQVEELQKSFIQMSDYKLEITEKLNCEQHLGRELNSQVIKLESELSKLRTILEAKDEEMIRLQNENTNLTKDVLQQSQLTDRLRHYEAKDNVTDIVQKELQEAREQIANLMTRNSELESIVSSNISEVKIHNKYEEGYNVAKRLIRENSSESSDVMETIPENDTPVSIYESRNDLAKITMDLAPILPTHEAMEKLQERFTRTMADVAELTEEKQRLEHLVLQLQSETETVGEYIALYQNQRSLLKQREMEKDNQLQKLAHDQDDMKNKLLKLNQLVVQLLHERNDLSKQQNVQSVVELSSSESNPNSNTDEIMKLSIDSANDVYVDKLRNNDRTVPAECMLKNSKSETAEKIISLLSELKTSNLINPYDGALMDNFAHHCHCCSGRLQTV